MVRIERGIHTLKWLRLPSFRRRIGAGLNKGEARHKLARAVFFNRLGEVRDRALENQQNRASGLNLVMQAITVWNTVYIDRAIGELRKHRQIDDALLPQVSPLGWGHIILTGDYDWGGDKQLKPGEFRALRPAPTHRAAAAQCERRASGRRDVGAGPAAHQGEQRMDDQDARPPKPMLSGIAPAACSKTLVQSYVLWRAARRVGRPPRVGGNVEPETDGAERHASVCQVGQHGRRDR
jgi:hypothetical protein